jgi:NAD(P)-dependent dehydrogenase (short-subunit alcohol dehydrogenase family)
MAPKKYGELRLPSIRTPFIQSDVADLKGHQDLVNKIVAEFGKIDILINNAGVFGTAPLGQITEADFDRVFSINTKVRNSSDSPSTFRPINNAVTSLGRALPHPSSCSAHTRRRVHRQHQHWWH